MHTIRLRCLALVLCCTPLVASAANITYFLNVPPIQGYEVFGTITTDGAAAPTVADVVDWTITFWSAAVKQSFTITPGNGSIGLFGGVTANPSGLVIGADLGDVVNWFSNQQCQPSLFFCYILELATNSNPHLHYGVSGFGLTDTVGQDHIPVPFATRLPRAKPPVLFRILHIITIGLETTPTLLQKVAAAQRYYEANDASDTCAQLTQLVTEAQAMSAAGAAPQSTITQIVGYANSIKMQIACAGCAG